MCTSHSLLCPPVTLQNPLAIVLDTISILVRHIGLEMPINRYIFKMHKVSGAIFISSLYTYTYTVMHIIHRHSYGCIFPYIHPCLPDNTHTPSSVVDLRHFSVLISAEANGQA